MAVIDIAFYLIIGIVVTVAFETLLNPILWFMVVLIADATLLISTHLGKIRHCDVFQTLWWRPIRLVINHQHLIGRDTQTVNAAIDDQAIRQMRSCADNRSFRAATWPEHRG